MTEIGISAEEFVEVCTKAGSSGMLDDAVAEQLLAVEDFDSALRFLWCVVGFAANVCRFVVLQHSKS